MGKRTGKPLGRPPKPEGETARVLAFSFPPELAERLEAAVPAGERSALVARAVAEALDARRWDETEG